MPTDPQSIDALLVELERLENAATPGPFEARTNYSTNHQTAYVWATKRADSYAHYQHPADAEYDAVLRNATPRMIAELRDLLTIARAANELLDRLDSVHADERYKSVWISYMIHGGKYTEPTYTAAMDRLRAELAGK